MNVKSIAILVWMVLMFTLPNTVHAEGKAKGHDKKNKASVVYKPSSGLWNENLQDGRIIIQFDMTDRQTIRSYLRERHAKKCPPGLAKKNNGCLPPGLAKKYAIGQKLPDDIKWLPVAEDLLSLLRPAPKGYFYANVDKDILLIAEATRKVVDAVTLLSAIQG